MSKIIIRKDVLLDNNKLTTKDSRGIGDGTITRTDGLITSVVIGGRTITINRDGDDLITGWEDSDYEWTLTKSGGVITAWAVTTV